MIRGRWSTWASQIGELYRSAAITTFGVILLLVLLNLGLGTIYLMRDAFWQEEPQVDPRVQSGRGRHVDLEAYSRLSPGQVNELLDDQDVFTSKGFLYAPWVQFHAPEFHSRWLNTDSNGYRITKAPPSSSRERFKVFVFGGSTTFGYGVSDEHTIPSYLQTLLEGEALARTVAVSNYGQGYYYSSQEMQVFLGLIKQGIVPDYAIFIDGLNEVGLRTQGILGYDEPWFTPEIMSLWDARRGQSQQGDAARDHARGEFTLLSRLPMVRFARSVGVRILPQFISNGDRKPESKPSEPDVVDFERVSREVESITSVYLANITMIQAICQQYRVTCLFVWQPVPFYKYDIDLLRNPDRRIRPHWQQVFTRMSGLRRNDFLYLGDMLEKSSAKAYVDQVHYNERANEEIAKAIHIFLRSDRRT